MLSSFAGGRVLGRRFGARPATVLALHGWRRSHADFDAVLDGMAAAVALDLPGFGASAAPEAAWGSADYADAVAPTLEEEGLDQGLVVVGHSFGGRVAIQLAAARPALVHALVLTGVPIGRPDGPPPAPSVAFRVARRLHRVGLVSDEAMERRRRANGSDDYRAASGVMRDVLVRAIAETNDGTYLRALREVKCPVELVWGERDTTAPVGNIELAASACPGDLNVSRLAGVGHLVPTEAPAALRDAIDRALR
jgi:pimeloyl-ACP methyl ester carboxylesterase